MKKDAIWQLIHETAMQAEKSLGKGYRPTKSYNYFDGREDALLDYERDKKIKTLKYYANSMSQARRFASESRSHQWASDPTETGPTGKYRNTYLEGYRDTIRELEDEKPRKARA